MVQALCEPYIYPLILFSGSTHGASEREKRISTGYQMIVDGWMCFIKAPRWAVLIPMARQNWFHTCVSLSLPRPMSLLIDGLVLLLYTRCVIACNWGRCCRHHRRSFFLASHHHVHLLTLESIWNFSWSQPALSSLDSIYIATTMTGQRFSKLRVGGCWEGNRKCLKWGKQHPIFSHFEKLHSNAVMLAFWSNLTHPPPSLTLTLNPILSVFWKSKNVAWYT